MPTSSHAIVYHLPHDSMWVPDDVRPTLLLDDKNLRDELLAMTDHCTVDLYSCAGHDRAIVFPVSRLVVDPERFTDDTQEPMARLGMGVIYTRTSAGRRLRLDPTTDERADLLSRFYHSIGNSIGPR